MTGERAKCDKTERGRRSYLSGGGGEERLKKFKEGIEIMKRREGGEHLQWPLNFTIDIYRERERESVLERERLHFYERFFNHYAYECWKFSNILSSNYALH